MQEMVFFYPQGHQAHFEIGHPERPERVEALRQALRQAGWWEAFPHLEALNLEAEEPGRIPLPLQGVHTERYLEILREACQHGMHLDMDTYTTPKSWQLALNAAGGAMAVSRAVWNGESRRGMALTRPPGHHATAGRGMGFCLINNVAVAAADLLRGQSTAQQAPAQRVAIIDLDLHHGNGTQDIFWRREDVLYISTHQSPLYPGSGNLDEVGAGPGEGATANFPLPPGTGDEGFRAVMAEAILPLLDRYAPQMLLVSFGFDPHWRDPLGHLLLSADGYGRLMAALAEWADRRCNGKMALFLEGGYDLDAGGACIQTCMAALLGQPWEDVIRPPPRPQRNSCQADLKAARQICRI